MQTQNANCKPPRKTGFPRILAAFSYSLDGLRSTFATEAAFRQEGCLVAICLLALIFLPLSHEWKGLLFFATATVLVVELLNSAIESVVDLSSPDYHLLAKRAKDIGSAAVLVSIALTVFLWIAALASIVLSKS
ncbi:diacylglycerol kinase [Desulfopila sp. IMCC35006]|uniref:diacylglycerol kinase n=1 Tax=Desulfopila sp. IMCC35006 TaxID=2569542 RepID=UPI0010AD8646|nr:diacylglycerol kinase [Desulfopila sp. IMCC35006]TKB24120.1 diacylglycerol kinase [Desulfopila sp. IMCC35006]